MFSYPELKICIDLNVWYRVFLAYKQGRNDTVCQKIISIVKDGYCSLQDDSYLVSLIVSYGMLNRLETVIRKDQKISASYINELIKSIEALATPVLTIGGTGIYPMKDQEDAHIFETSVASKSHFLITNNIKDFIEETRTDIDFQIIEDKKIAEYRLPGSDGHAIYIITPEEFIRYVKTRSDLEFEGKEIEIA